MDHGFDFVDVTGGSHLVGIVEKVIPALESFVEFGDPP